MSSPSLKLLIKVKCYTNSEILYLVRLELVRKLSDKFDTFSTLSSGGPTTNRRKPDIAALGSDILSASIESDTSYDHTKNILELVWPPLMLRELPL